MDSVSHIGAKRSSRKSNNKRPHRRTSITSTVTPAVNSLYSKSKPKSLCINTDIHDSNIKEEHDLFHEVAKKLDLSDEQVVSLYHQQSPKTPLATATKKKLAPNYVKILSKQRQKGITYELILEVSYYIRTSDSWLERFIHDGGMQILAKELGTLHKKQNRLQNDYKIEYELLKCLDILMNKKSGLQEAFKHSRIIDNFCISIVSPYIPARTQACESLTAFCFLPNGRSMVLGGLELLKRFNASANRFDAWMQALEKTLDGRGKMGSAVGASHDLKAMGMVGAGDSQITQYMFISVLFINTLIRPDIVDSRKERISLHHELEQAGLHTVFKKMKLLNHDHIHLVIQAYRDEVEADAFQEEMEGYHRLDIQQVVQLLLNRTYDTPSFSILHNIFTCLLKIQDNSEKSLDQYQRIDTLIQQIATDQTLHGLNVKEIIPKFSTFEGSAQRRSHSDGSDDLIGSLEAKIEYLEKDLSLSKQTNAMLKILFKSTEERYKSELLDTESKMRKLHDSVRNLTEYGNPSPKRRTLRNQPDKKPTKSNHLVEPLSPESVPETWKKSFKSKIGNFVRKSSSHDLPVKTAVFEELDHYVFPTETTCALSPSSPPPPPPPPPLPVVSPIEHVPSSSSFQSVRSPIPPPPTFLGMTGRKPSVFQAKQKLKFVEWEKISQIKETIWSELDMPIELDSSDNGVMEYQLAKAGVFDDVELAFAQKPAIELKSKSQKRKETNILDTKKAHNINIFIQNIIKKIPLENVRSLFLQFDPYFMDEQVILNLLRYLPSEEEKKSLLMYEHVHDLGAPEQFCLQMLKISRLKERLECMLFKSTFWEKYTLLHKQMTSVYNASLALKDAKQFKELLHLVLLLGNFLNGDTYRGGAFGIKIASINKLIDTKGTSKTTTLLHFLVDAVEKNFPHILGFLEELDECGFASKVSRGEMNTEYQSIETDLKKLAIELGHHDALNETIVLDKFSAIMHQFYKEASTEFKRIVMLSKKMDETYDQCVRFYGEDPQKMQPDEFFGVFKAFTTSWEKCSADAKVHKLQQDRLERQKKREQEKRKKIVSKDDVLRSLLDKLKKDTLETKRHWQRSTVQPPSYDSTLAKANQMLFTIQFEPMSKEGQRRKSTSVISVLLEDENPLKTESVDEKAPIRPSSDIVIPTASQSNDSNHSSKLVRKRKTSKRPIFDHSLRAHYKTNKHKFI